MVFHVFEQLAITCSFFFFFGLACFFSCLACENAKFMFLRWNVGQDARPLQPADSSDSSTAILSGAKYGVLI